MRKEFLRKAMSLGLSIAMAFSCAQNVGAPGSAYIYADTESSDQLFAEGLTGSNWTCGWSCLGWVDGGSGTLEEGWNYYASSSNSSDYAYQTLSLKAGEYTISGTVEIGNSKKVKIYPYVDGQITSYYISSSSSKTQSFSYKFDLEEDATVNVGYYFSNGSNTSGAWANISNLALSGEWEVDESESGESGETEDTTDYSIEESESTNLVQKDRYFRRSSEGNSWTDTSLSDYWGYEYLSFEESEWWVNNTDSEVTSLAIMNNYDGEDTWSQNLIWNDTFNLTAGTYTFSLTMANWDSNNDGDITVVPYVYAEDMTGITICDEVTVTAWGYGGAAAQEMTVVCEQDVAYASIGFTISCAAGSGVAFSDANIYYASNEGAAEVTGTFDGVEWTNSDGDTQYVNGGNFVKGVDISSIISEEAAGTVYKNSNGVNTDIFETLKNNGVNYVRIRVFNDPYDTSGVTYGGGANDAETAVMIAQRAADVGLGVFLSFHLSDFWADPAAQLVPKDWSSLSTSNKASSAATFVSETLSDVLATGADVGMVTIGNETAKSSNIIAGTTTMSAFVTIVESCSTAVRAVDSDIMVGVHVSASSGITYMAGQMKSADSNFFDDYVDLYAVSVYPYWTSHGTVTNCQTQLNTVANTYGVKTMVAEYNWPYAVGSDQDGSSYISSSTSGLDTSAYDVSVSGQSAMITDMFEKFSECTDMIGMFYWEPAWIGVGNYSGSWSSSNAQKWLYYGCGVATYAGASYLGWSGYSSNSSSGSIANGSAADEYALFAANGKPTDALSALNMTSDEMPIDEVLAQVTETPTSSGKFNLRMVGRLALDDANDYDSCGFKFEYGNGSAHTTLKEVGTVNVYDTVTANGEQISAGDGYKFYTYNINGIPAKSATYYFKIITLVNGSATGKKSFQQKAKYYKLTTTTESASLEEISAWEYVGFNSEVSHSKMDGTTNGKFELYPDYIQ